MEPHTMPTKEQIAFKQLWVNHVLTSFDKEGDREKESALNQLYDLKYRKSFLEIENTYNAKITKVPAENFYLKAKKNFILNESGSLTWQHHIKTGSTIPVTLNNIKIRQIKKRAKVKAEAEGDTNLYSILKNEEYALKIIINGFYGLSLYNASTFFNPSVAATITSAGRNVISTSCLTVELIGGGFRNYLVSAYIQLINNSKKETPDLVGKYTLPKVTRDQVLKHMLGFYYDDYYNKTFLENLLDKCTPEELSVMYIKNNFDAFIDIPEVKEIIEEILERNIKHEDNLNELDASIRQMTIDNFGNDPSIFRKYMYNFTKDPKFKDLTKKLHTMAGDLIFGFYYYDGDYLDGIYRETSVDIVENMDRTMVPTMDTDSNVTTLYTENRKLNKVFSKYMEGDKFMQDVVSTAVCTIIFTGAIDKSLYRYTRSIGVAPEYAKLIEMEVETIMYNLHLTTSKKKYIFNYLVQDGNLNLKPFDKVKIRGLQVIKSDYNEEISQKVIDLYKNKIMVKLEKLDYADIIISAKKLTDEIDEMVHNDTYILEKSTIKKSNKSLEELSFGNYKAKLSRLWDRFNLPGELDYPGSFKEIEIKLSEDLIEELKRDHEYAYKAFKEHTAEIKLYKFYTTAVNNAGKILSGKRAVALSKIEAKHSNYIPLIKKLATKINTLDKDKMDTSIAVKLYNDLHPKDVEEEYNKSLLRAFDITKKIDTLEVSDNDIIENNDKIGLPVGIVEVPSFLKIQNYGMLNHEFIVLGESLLAVLVDTLGISCPRNKADQLMISSALQSY